MNIRRFPLPFLKLSLAVWACTSSSISAQFMTELLPDQDIGRPPRPPFISFLGIAATGKMVTDSSTTPKGSVAEILVEELRAETTPAGFAGEVLTSVKTKYDELGRSVEEIRKESGRETVTVNAYQGTRLVSQETTFPSQYQLLQKAWNYWTYDPSAKLTEFRRGRGDKIENHLANFQRDRLGRLTSFDYRQGKKDELSSHTEFRYSPDGKTIDTIESYKTGESTSSTTQIMDDQGHVVQVIIREWDWQTKKPKSPLKVTFSYDKEGRLVEQNTDAHDFEPAGSEQELPPGKVSIVFDDIRHTKNTVYSGKEGFLSSIVTYNSSGAAIGAAYQTGDQSFETKLECTYDSHENWTSCRQLAKNGGVSSVTEMWRRTITCR
jgi:hypothetical protein